MGGMSISDRPRSIDVSLLRRDVESMLEEIVDVRDQPRGRVRLLVTPLSAAMVLAPKLGVFGGRFPDVVLEVATTQEGRTELVVAGFDAALRSASPFNATWLRFVFPAISAWPS